MISVSHGSPSPPPQTGVRKVSCFPGAEEVGSLAPDSHILSVSVSIYMLVVYSFGESPLWCVDAPAMCSVQHSCSQCKPGGSSYLPLWGGCSWCVLILNFPLLNSQIWHHGNTHLQRQCFFHSPSPLWASLLTSLGGGGEYNQQRHEEWKRKAGCICYVMCAQRRRSTASTIPENCLHIGPDGCADCLFVPWQIHSTCVAAAEADTWGRRAEDEIGRRTGEEEGMRGH